MYLEIFKTGKHKSGNGFVGEYNIESLDKIANLYKERTFTNPKDLSPVVAGHPASDSPALGWVNQIFRRGNSLVADVDILDKDFLESLKNGQYKNVSIAIDSDFNFVHLGFLGAATPAVSGLNPLKYTAYSEFSYNVEFSSLIDDSFSELNDLIKSLEDKNKSYEEQIIKYERQLELVSTNEFIREIESQNKFQLKDDLKKDISDVLFFANSLENNNSDEKQISNKLKEFVKGFIKFKTDNLSEIECSNKSERRIDSESNNRKLLHSKIIELTTINPQMTYEDALSSVFN